MVLNITYAMLRTEVIRAVLQCGLDPCAGILHSATRNKPALVLDLMEMFRPVIADAVVRQLFNKSMLSEKDFSYASTGISFNGRDPWRNAAGAMQTRLDTEHEYIEGGYRISWRRTIDYVVRSFVQYVDGTRSTWDGVYIR